jgi:RND superfamily putative drug exporter
VRRTGRIITSAGVIFAGTFVAMMISPVVTLEQTGFTIALGLVLDTIVVRSFLVPAVAVSLGRWNWWPRRPGPAAMPQTSPAHLRLSRSSVAPAAPIQD